MMTFQYVWYIVIFVLAIAAVVRMVMSFFVFRKVFGKRGEGILNYIDHRIKESQVKINKIETAGDEKK